MDVKKFVADLHDYLGQALSPLVARIKALEDRPAPVIPEAIKGEKGDKGDSVFVSQADLAEIVREYLTRNPPPKGEKGDPGASVKGDRGDDGSDAVIEHDQIVVACEEVHARTVDRFLVDFERRGRDAVDALVARAIDRLPVPKNGEDGVDGLGFEDLEFVYDGLRSLTIRAVRGDRVREKTFHMPIIIDAGFYRDGMTIAKGDAVTHDGSLWIALKDAPTEKPGYKATEDWRLAARKGRDGMDRVAASGP